MIAKNSMKTSIRTKLPSYFPKKYEFHQASAQRGITLIMVLIFIVTLSLIAAVGMRGVITGDRVVANEFDRALSFQATESTIREAVDLIASDGAYTLAGKIPGGLPLGGNIEHWRTTSDKEVEKDCKPIDSEYASKKRFNWADCSAKSASASKYSNAEAPSYVIELVSKVPVGAASPPTKIECWYRITSRATGGTKEADVILQAMFSQEVSPGKCSSKEKP
jgi:Tfp pilus assembly protein PilX